MEVRLADPPGARSCGSGGVWECCRAPGKHNTNYWLAEYEALRRACSKADAHLIKAELRSKMRRATQGKLRFGASADVNQMQICPIILEIRVRAKMNTPAGGRVVRLYFSEPAHEESMLLAAKLAWKPPDGRKEQNGHAVEAGERVRAFFT